MDNISLELLKVWKDKPNINPLTKRKIKINGPTYKRLKKVYNDKLSNSHQIKKTKFESSYVEYREKMMDPVLKISLKDIPDDELFIYKNKWNPYNGEKLDIEDENGPLYFDPDVLIHYYYSNRLNNLWNSGFMDNFGNWNEGHYGDGVNNGPDFKINSRGQHPEWYLFRIPIIDEYIYSDHCYQSVTMGPKLSESEIMDIYEKSKKNPGKYREMFGRRKPNLILLRQFYEMAISKNENFNSILGNSLNKEEIDLIKYTSCTEAVNKLKYFR